MTEYELEELTNKIDMEGFEYTLLDYSDWKEIKDKEFHRLRRAFVDARDNLQEYIDGENARTETR